MMSETVGNYVGSCHTTFGKILIFISFFIFTSTVLVWKLFYQFTLEDMKGW